MLAIIYGEGYAEIKSDHNYEIDIDKSTYDTVFSELPLNIGPKRKFILHNKIKVGF